MFGNLASKKNNLCSSFSTVIIVTACIYPFKSHSKEHYFRIERMPLNEAIIALANQADIQIIFDSDIEREGQSVQVIDGKMDVTQALEMLLKSSDMSFIQIREGVLVVVKPDKKKQVQATINSQNEDIDEMTVYGTVIFNGARTENLHTEYRTGLFSGRSIMDSGMAISSLSAQAIQNIDSITSSDTFRRIPGLRVDDSGGDGNTNISLRGLPFSEGGGGGRYLLVHEDGLPILMFGDMRFATLDTLIRVDKTVDRIESIRGGKSSTRVSNSPGGLINLISKTGETLGGSVSSSTGLNKPVFRIDYDYANSINNNWRYYIGGFYREGNRFSGVDYTTEKGGQIKANITAELSHHRIRLSLKYLNDKTLAVMYSPLTARGEGREEFDSFDLTQSRFLTRSFYLDEQLNRKESNITDGQNPNLKSLGFNWLWMPNESFTAEVNARASSINGHWVATTFGQFIYPDEQQRYTYNMADGSLISGTALRANGPSIGELYTDPIANIKVIDTTWNDLSNVFVEYVMHQKFGRNGLISLGTLTGIQKYDVNWNFADFLTESKGNNAALIDLVDTDGAILTEHGLVHYGTNWGGCCNRRQNLEFRLFAPFVSAEFNISHLTLDLSARYDQGWVTGEDYVGSLFNAGDVDGDGVVSIVESVAIAPDKNTQVVIDWHDGDWSFASGLNYRVSETSSFYVRWSQGVRANADRSTDIFFADQNLAKTSGSSSFGYDRIEQTDFGFKYSKDTISLNSSVFLTRAELDDFSSLSGSMAKSQYNSQGLEIEVSKALGRIQLNGFLTYIDSEIEMLGNDLNNDGNRPYKQPEFIYNVSVSYNLEDVEAGVELQGVTGSYTGNANMNKIPGYKIFNTYLNYQFSNSLSMRLTARNIVNTPGVDEGAENGYRLIGDRTVTMGFMLKF